jgi:membrane protein
MVSPFASSRNVEIHPSHTEQRSVCSTNHDLQLQVRCYGLDLFLHPRATLILLKAAYSQWIQDKAPRMGAALAYYTIFSLAPLLIIAVAISGLVFGAQAAQGQITGQIEGLVGHDGARAIQAMIQSVHKPAESVFGSVVGLLLLLIGASGVLCEMQDALNTIWHVKADSQGGIREIVKERFFGFGMVLGIGFLLLVSLILSAVLTAVAKYLTGVLPIPAVFLHGCDFLLSLLFITVLFATIFKFLPNVKIAWSDVWSGAVLTSLLFTLGKFLIGFYIGNSVSESTYGAAASLVIVVAWIYYSALLLYFGAEFTRVFANQAGSQFNGDTRQGEARS